MIEQLVPSGASPLEKTNPAWWFLFAAHDHKILVLEESASVSLPLIVDPAAIGLSAIRGKYLGTLAGVDCYCAEVQEKNPLPPKSGFYGLREIHGLLDERLFAIAMKALHLLDWEGTARYCGCCGKETVSGREAHARECPACGMVVFPRISPAVIVLVEKDGQVLLARGTRFKTEIFSVLAGFVEPGETLEDAIHREIEEEVGIKVRDVRYFGSQPWPFPDSLMIGFTAKYASGELKIDKTEIVEAGWFFPENLPNIPGTVSIARRLIDWFVETRRQEEIPPAP
ncbi:MAG: NADH pyrophosphatase [Syntrophus sp. PtaU1.Bin208]|nr:MAG: NADH pyrophosphatase [Syntrophus sp. PtaU1.Bin208]